MVNSSPHFIDTLDKLDTLFGELSPASTLKEIDYLHPVYQRIIAASPFLTIASCGPEGLDVSPRGDPAGFVAVQDDKTLLLPERRGNNRIDTLRNIVRDPRVSLLFLVPGIGETLRINGRARISVEPALLMRLSMKGQLPKCVLVISVETVFFQCARALQRSKLWAPRAANEPRRVPTAGEILAAVTEDQFDGATYDRELPARQNATLY
jgi:PPOX class probable FMN-dependent enzyme